MSKESYRQAIKNRQFARALSLIPIQKRFGTARKLWMAFRLGLYRTVISHKPFFLTLRSHFIYHLAIIKIFAYSNDSRLVSRSLKAIEKMLFSCLYSQFHQEICHELISYYPNLVLKFLSSKDSKFFTQSLDKYLTYLTLISELHESKMAINKLSKNVVNLDKIRSNAEGLYLLSNLGHDIGDNKLHAFNRILSMYDLLPIDTKNGQKFCVSNFECAIKSSNEQYKYIEERPNHIDRPKVSIIVTTYNAEQTIDACLNSLQQQTWQNLEIIVVDDCSEDLTVSIINTQRVKDQRIKLIELPVNCGTFVSKSIGAIFASGDLMTCQDSDDWAHPQKIERQAMLLLTQKNLVATLSQWVRIDDNGNYYARNYYPKQNTNPASLMFWFEKTKSELGLWHLVRTGADSEFIERFRSVYGKDQVAVIKEPLTLASHRENSLTTSKEYGLLSPNGSSDRQLYWERWRLWHIKSLAQKSTIKMPHLFEQLIHNDSLFEVPKNIQVNYNDVRNCLIYLNIKTS